MIKSKKELKNYIRADVVNNKFDISFFYRFTIIYRFLKALRKTEYYLNTNKKIRYLFSDIKLRRLSVKSGISIRPNTFEKGLVIPHYGYIVVNGNSHFGENCVLQCGVNISQNVIGGNHIYFATGCKILKNLTIEDDVIIGANSVVTKSIIEKNSVWAGIPAHKISDKGYKDRNEV